MTSTILVTGAAGFIGSTLCELLIAKGYRVIGLDNFSSFYPRPIKERNLQGLQESADFRFFELNLLDAAGLAALPKFDAVIHLAARAGVRPSIENPQDYIDTNITGTHAILKLCIARGVYKIVSASSSSIYGNSKIIPFVEEGPEYEPISPYAFTKRSTELMNYTYHHLYKLDILNLRFFTVYGPRQRPDLAIHKFTKLISEGKSIPMFGDGSTARDYTYVADTVDGIMRSLEYLFNKDKVFEIINLGNNTPVKLLDLIDALGRAVGKEPIIEQMPMQEGDVDITFANIEKAKRLLGYDPKTKLDEGLAKFVKWYTSIHATV